MTFTVEFFASKEQHMMQLYCSRYLNNAYRFYWRSLGLCYASPPFSQLSKVLTKIALEGARLVLCTPYWGTKGDMPIGGACWTVSQWEVLNCPTAKSTLLRTLMRPCPPQNEAVSCPS